MSLSQQILQPNEQLAWNFAPELAYTPVDIVTTNINEIKSEDIMYTKLSTIKIFAKNYGVKIVEHEYTTRAIILDYLSLRQPLSYTVSIIRGLSTYSFNQRRERNLPLWLLLCPGARLYVHTYFQRYWKYLEGVYKQRRQDEKYIQKRLNALKRLLGIQGVYFKLIHPLVDTIIDKLNDVCYRYCIKQIIKQERFHTYEFLQDIILKHDEEFDESVSDYGDLLHNVRFGFSIPREFSMKDVDLETFVSLKKCYFRYTFNQVRYYPYVLPWLKAEKDIFKNPIAAKNPDTKDEKEIQFNFNFTGKPVQCTDDLNKSRTGYVISFENKDYDDLKDIYNNNNKQNNNNNNIQINNENNSNFNELDQALNDLRNEYDQPIPSDDDDIIDMTSNSNQQQENNDLVNSIESIWQTEKINKNNNMNQPPNENRNNENDKQPSNELNRLINENKNTINQLIQKQENNLQQLQQNQEQKNKKLSDQLLQMSKVNKSSLDIIIQEFKQQQNSNKTLINQQNKNIMSLQKDNNQLSNALNNISSLLGKIQYGMGGCDIPFLWNLGFHGICGIWGIWDFVYLRIFVFVTLCFCDFVFL